MAKANKLNYSRLEAWLEENNIEYSLLSPHQYRILGEVALVDVWPARMTVHVLQTESVDPNRYFRMSYEFHGKELERVLNGKTWNEA